MIEYIGEPASLEMLAEEATELAHAALKLARIKRGENPSPVPVLTATQNVIEEFTDVCLCAEDLGLKVDEEIKFTKLKRFDERWGKFKEPRRSMA